MSHTITINQNPPTFKNYAELFHFRSMNNENDPLYTFLKDEEVVEKLTFGSMYTISRNLAAHFQNRFSPRTPVLLLFPAGLDFIKVFMGCLLANIIPIPLSLPRQRQSDFDYIRNVGLQASISGVLTVSSVNQFFHLEDKFSHVTILNVDQLDTSITHPLTPVDIHPNDIAFLQYTSGSTGTPKGVMVSHANLLHNQKLIQHCYGVTSQSIFMSWLPHYHDMGLIGTLLHQIYSGCQTILMSPTSFLQKPFRWLSAISKYRASISGAPNFAYELCIKRISEEQMKHLDLTSWKIAFNGAEKVNAVTMDNFTKIFAKCGFELKQFFPTYGLAESTLLVSGGEINHNPIYINVDRTHLENNKIIEVSDEHPNAQKLVSSGIRCLDLEIEIVNPSSNDCVQSAEIGEIWLKGPSVALGYWNNPEKTTEHFQAYLSNKKGPYFRTGDMGFIHNHNLFITGRIKDLIIIRGRNIYPEDIEVLSQSVDKSLRIGNGAAFSVEIENHEQLFLIQEVERTSLKYIDTQKVVKKISKAVMDKFDLQIFGVVLIMPQTLLKTTSGKIKRSENRKLFLENKLPFIYKWMFNTSTEQVIDSYNAEV